MDGLPFRIAEARFFVAFRADEAFGLHDLVVDAAERDLFATRAVEHIAPAAAFPEVDLADLHLCAARPPPVRDMLGFGERFEDEAARRVEGAGEQNLRVGRKGDDESS